MSVGPPDCTRGPDQVSGSFWPAGVHEAVGVAAVHRQAHRLPGSHDAAGREAGRPPSAHQFAQNVSTAPTRVPGHTRTCYYGGVIDELIL